MINALAVTREESFAGEISRGAKTSPTKRPGRLAIFSSLDGEPSNGGGRLSLSG
jgi:hypothetical protein